MLLGGALALAAQVAFTPPEVRGAGDCPSVAAVAAHLAPMLPRAGGAGDADVVEISSTGDATTVRLKDPAGNVVNERTTSSTCSERATEIAVLVAIWEADLHTDVVFPPSVADAQDAPAAPVAAISRAQTPPMPTSPSARAEASVGAAFSLVAPPSQGVAPAGWIEATWSRGLPLRARLALLGTGTHEIALGPGTVTWRRVSLGLGALAELGRGRARASVRAGALVAALISRGSGFSLDQSATAWQLGADAGLRGGIAVTPGIVLWADVGLAGFPGTQRVTVLNVAERPTVPRWEAAAALGASFSWWP